MVFGLVAASWAGLILLAAGPADVAVPGPFDAGALLARTLTVGAMMLLIALPAAEHVSRESLRRRRRAAVSLFLVAFVAVWVGCLTVVEVALDGLLPSSPIAQTAAIAITCVAAAIWQMSPQRAMLSSRCARASILPPTGSRAAVGDLRFGFRSGLGCFGSCWAVMLVMALMPGSHLVIAAILTGALTADRLVIRVRRRPGVIAVGLVGLGIATLASASSPTTTGFIAWICSIPGR